MSAGKVNINQTIELHLNMYFDEGKRQFQDKKVIVILVIDSVYFYNEYPERRQTSWSSLHRGGPSSQ